MNSEGVAIATVAGGSRDTSSSSLFGSESTAADSLEDDPPAGTGLEEAAAPDQQPLQHQEAIEIDDDGGDAGAGGVVIDLTAEDPAEEAPAGHPAAAAAAGAAVAAADDEDLEDFQLAEAGSSRQGATVKVKLGRVKKRRLSDDDKADAAAAATADEGCSICFEAWTSSGEHRVSALRCGHLFGRSCVERWLETRPQCPQCNRPARRHDLVLLYVSNLRALDTSELESLKADLERTRRGKLDAEQEASDMRLRMSMLREENKRLVKQLDFYRSHATKPTIDLTESGSGSDTSYVLESQLSISHTGECRVLALNQPLNVLCISQPSRNPLFRGYGLRKLDLVDFRNSSYIHLHTNKLRDVCFNPDGTLLLSAGMDKQARLTSFHSEQTVCYFDCPAAVWSCCWSPFDANQFYAGLGNGQVLCFDMRHTGSHVGDPLTCGVPSATSVVSLASFPASLQQGSPAALLAGQFDRLSLYQRPAGAAEPAGVQLPSEGQLAWLAADPASRHALLTHRPSVNQPQVQQQQQRSARNHVEHSVYGLEIPPSGDESSGAEPGLRPLSRIRAGPAMKLLARSRLYQQAGRRGSLTVAAGDEATCRLNLWDAASGDQLQSLPRLPLPVLDIAPVRQGKFLACLTEQILYLYKDAKAD